MLRLQQQLDMDYRKCSCGAKLERVVISQQHTNGLWNEKQEFKCGRIDVFVPNFQDLVPCKPDSTPCPKSPEEAERLAVEQRQLEDAQTQLERDYPHLGPVLAASIAKTILKAKKEKQ
jgi:hypothetical protein